MSAQDRHRLRKRDRSFINTRKASIYMGENPKYSVIIPVYNAEKTLRRCLDSLLAETREDAEIILVNDGSKDRSGEICREYAAEKPCIRWIEKENGGVSSARNAGLDAATGQYILFVDSDDYVAPTFFSTIDRVRAETPGDLIQFSGRFDNGKQTWGTPHKPLSLQGRDALMPTIVDAICRKTINGPVAKLYRRDLIELNRLRFPVGASVAEDRVFNIVYSFYIQSYSVTDKVIYYVSTENENSLTRGRNKDLKRQLGITDGFFYGTLEKAPLSAQEKDSYQRAFNFGACRLIYHDAKLMHLDHVAWFARQKRLGQICDEINRKHMKYPGTRYCRLITLPVRLHLTPVIDAIAWKLTH